ncbi:hypothetical protein DKY63_13075 [Pseudomonas putida]|uniref:Uncharacterized protein n=1 Tax=Pseudomonas putida TaxID=303 RepID=A0A2Z4RL71_PSEPU|nr:hypothetical protein [Pseudomonas putida]AWY40774.1 hypothetical protein DKY63_13075 [Pseudomonas putida]
MTGLKNLILAFTVLGVSAAAHAADNGFTWPGSGQTGNKARKSTVLKYSNVGAAVAKDSTWGAHLPRQNSHNGYYATYDKVSVSHNGIKLFEQDLMGRYDLTGMTGQS